MVEPDEAIEEETPDSPGIEKHDREKDHKDPKKFRCKFFFLWFAGGLSDLILLAPQRCKQEAEYHLQCFKSCKMEVPIMA